MRLIALVCVVPALILIATGSVADNLLKGLRLSCTGESWDTGEDREVHRNIEFFGQVADNYVGSVFVDGAGGDGMLSYYYNDTTIVVDRPMGCSKIGGGACNYYGVIDRATGNIDLSVRRSDGKYYGSLLGRCVPFKALF